MKFNKTNIKFLLILFLVIIAIWIHTAMTPDKYDPEATSIYNEISIENLLENSKDEKIRTNFGATYIREYKNLDDRDIIFQYLRNTVIQHNWEIIEEHKNSLDEYSLTVNVNSSWFMRITINKKTTSIVLKT